MKEVFIKQEQSGTTIVFCENGKIIETYLQQQDNIRMEGNIYLGRVENVLKGMQAAFIDIGEGKNTFIHLKDILPKLNEAVCTKESNQIQEQNIKDYIKPGDTILVQVKRDATSKKGARVSSHISLTSRFLVMMPETPFVTISQKIEQEEERIRLLEIVKKNLPPNMGAIIRTSAEGKAQEEIKQDMSKTIKNWEDIKQKARKSKQVPILLYQNEGMVEKCLRDTIDTNITRIVVNTKELQSQVQEILEITQHKEDVSLTLETKEDIFDTYEIQEQLEKLQNRKVWLKCGGFITIDRTEALTAVDVNSGKYIGTKNLEQTVLKVNKEASVEIAKQLRLRDIGGIIIIDYIDMQKEESKKQVMDALAESLKQDRSKTQIAGFTKLNLLEMTRKHMYSNS